MRNGKMSKYRVYSPDSPDENDLEKKNRILARTIAEEGIVLLENNGVLPFKEKKVALFGAGARHTVRGGTGSGDMRERYSVTIESGLKNAGIEITTQKWLDSYDLFYNNHRKEWETLIEKEIKEKGFFNFMAPFEVIAANPLLFPVGNVIKPDELTDANETAIYVIARQAGEGADRKEIKGDFLLYDVEFENLRILKLHYAKLIVVINCGGLIDLSFVAEIKPDALLYINQPGTEGGNALANILTGKVTPSGKLTDTWGMRYADYPSCDRYDRDAANEDYKEGILVGYRYFDAMKIKPRYNFGYGLSYTKFSVDFVSISKENGNITLKVKVKNTGKFAGKEVVQVYVSKPTGKIVKESKLLCSFAKTKLLQPSEEQTIELKIQTDSLASFYSDNRCWMIDTGKYGIGITDGICDLRYCAYINVDETIITEYVSIIGDTPNQDMQIKAEVAKFSDDLPHIEITRDDIIVKRPSEKLNESYSDTTKKWVASLTDKELVSLTVGGSLVGNCFNNTPGAVGRTTSKLVKKGIANINFSDGPAGLNVFPESVITKGGAQKYLNSVPESYNWGIYKKLKRFLLGNPKKGRVCYQYMTAFPAETMQAQTWNTEIIENVGRAVGREMTEIGVTLWLAPGINIHRNPLCGRNFEYYSEDPFLTGQMAAAITIGVQSNKGVGVTIKHFCCNNREQNREHVSSNVSERALREIYLKGFEICVKEANPKAVMSSYNKVNGKYVNNSYELLTGILRLEWGFGGLVMSDWMATGGDKGDILSCAKAGNDLIMPGSGKARKTIYKALKQGKISRDDIIRSASRVLQIIADSNVNV